LAFNVVASVVAPETFNVSFSIVDPEITILEADITPPMVVDPLSKRLPFTCAWLVTTSGPEEDNSPSTLRFVAESTVTVVPLTKRSPVISALPVTLNPGPVAGPITSKTAPG
jgi:hypothetical protein